MKGDHTFLRVLDAPWKALCVISVHSRAYLQKSSQGSNVLNKQMQGLWSAHRRGKINLNSAPPTPPVDEPPLPVPDPEAPATPTINGKRKVRSSRTEDSSSKRPKTSGGGAIAKDYTPPTARLADLGGIEGCIEKMLELVAMPLCHPEIYLHTGVQAPRGVLLHGPPGSGKTLLANAIAGARSTRCLNSNSAYSVTRNWVCLSLASQPRPSSQACPANLKKPCAILSRKPRLVYCLVCISPNNVYSGLLHAYSSSTKSMPLLQNAKVLNVRWSAALSLSSLRAWMVCLPLHFEPRPKVRQKCLGTKQTTSLSLSWEQPTDQTHSTQRCAEPVVSTTKSVWAFPTKRPVQSNQASRSFATSNAYIQDSPSLVLKTATGRRI